MRKRLINTNWIRQWHPQRAVAVGKPDWLELERGALTAGRGCTESRGGRDGWKSLVWWAHFPTIWAVGEETPWEKMKNAYLWENLNPRWTCGWHSLPLRLVDVSRNCVCVFLPHVFFTSVWPLNIEDQTVCCTCRRQGNVQADVALHLLQEQFSPNCASRCQTRRN